VPVVCLWGYRIALGGLQAVQVSLQVFGRDLRYGIDFNSI